MMVRIWRTGVKPERFEEYERFAWERSLPMFREQRGFIGVVFMREKGARSWWANSQRDSDDGPLLVFWTRWYRLIERSAARQPHHPSLNRSRVRREYLSRHF